MNTIVQSGTVSALRTANLENNMTITTIRNLTVAPQGVNVNDLSFALSSEKGLQQAYRTLFFGASSALLSHCVNYSKMIALVDRFKSEGRTYEAQTLETSTRFLEAKEKASASAIRAATLHTFDDTLEVDFTPQLRRGSSIADLTKKAEWSGASIEQIKNIEMNSATRAYNDQQSAKSTAEMLFWSADIEDYDEEGSKTVRPIFVNPHSILKSMLRTRDWILGWNEPDFTELGLIKHDILVLEKAAKKFDDYSESAGESSREIDNGGASSQDLADGNAAA